MIVQRHKSDDAVPRPAMPATLESSLPHVGPPELLRSPASTRDFFSNLVALARERSLRGALALSACADIIRLYSLYFCKFRGTHVGSCLSVAETLAVLYLRDHVAYSRSSAHAMTDPTQSDPFILSVGHAVPAFYALQHMLGNVCSERFAETAERHGLPRHPQRNLAPEIVFLSSGSLGQGLNEGLGAARVLPGRAVFVLLGDGETEEGNINEGILCGGASGLQNLVAIVDCNKIQLSGPVAEHGFTAPRIARLFELAGWNVLKVDGHDAEDLDRALQSARTRVSGAPSALIADTLMGKGVSFMEEEALRGRSTFHTGSSALTDEKFRLAEEEVRGRVDRTLSAIDPEWRDSFVHALPRAADFALPAPRLHEEPGGRYTQGFFADALCRCVQDGIPVAYVTGDLFAGGSSLGGRVRAAIEEKKRISPEYRGFSLNPGIREIAAMTQVKGIARASERYDAAGGVIRQEIVPVFTCYAPMVNLAIEPVRVAAGDRLQFILNTPLFGYLYGAGGNSHLTGISTLVQFLPVFYPSTEIETERVVRLAAEEICAGKDGRCCIATSSRFKVTPSRLGDEILLERETIEQVNEAVRLAWEKNAPYETGAYLVGTRDSLAHATIVTSGPLLYFCFQAKRILERHGLAVNVVNVLKFSREGGRRLADALSALLPQEGLVLTAWDGDWNMLFERVCVSAMTGGKGAIQCTPHGVTEEWLAAGSLEEGLESSGLRPSRIAAHIEEALQVRSAPGGRPRVA
jgi:transketolase